MESQLTETGDLDMLTLLDEDKSGLNETLSHRLKFVLNIWESKVQTSYPSRYEYIGRLDDTLNFLILRVFILRVFHETCFISFIIK